MNWLHGKKTYILCAGYLIYAAIGFGLGEIDANQAFEYVQMSGIGATIRHGVG